MPVDESNEVDDDPPDPDDDEPDPPDPDDGPSSGRAEERATSERATSERAAAYERSPTERGAVGEREGDRLSETIRARLEHLVPELVRKTFSAGLGAVYSTEEGIRKIAKDINLPDVAGYLASSADATKDRVMEVVARETREFLEHINLSEEIAKLLTTLSFEIKTEIRFIPNSDRFIGSEPDVKASVRLKRSDEEPKERDVKDKERDPEARSRRRFWRRDDEEDKS
ncbi:MAG: hypothetical protein R3B48_17530 [Kofleriaceae bacterium]